MMTSFTHQATTIQQQQPHQTHQEQKQHLTSTTAPGVLFGNRAELAAHYQTDWHRYNLKRREAGLPVLLYPDFMARLQAAQSLRQEQQQQRNGLDHRKKDNNKKKGKNKKQHQYEKKKKSRSNGGGPVVVSQVPSYQRIKDEEEYRGIEKRFGESLMLGNDKVDDVVDAVTASETGGETKKPEELAMNTTNTEALPSVDHEDVDEQCRTDEANDETFIEIDPCQSLFDRHVSANVDDNLKYMSKEFGFFLPDREFIIDLKGLIGYCHEKIQLGHVCLYCQRVFSTASACQKHMIAREHCKLQYETGIDLEDLNLFYDFDTANAEFRNKIGRRAKIVGNKKSQDQVIDPMEDNDDNSDENWEDISEDEEIDNDLADDNEDNLYEGFDDEVARMGLDVTSLGELIFPDGRIVGHRAFQRYYKQSAPRRAAEQSTAVLAARNAAGERLYRGQVYNIGNGSITASEKVMSNENALVLARAGVAPAHAAGRSGKGILVTGANGSWTQLSVYRYRAALRKHRKGEFKGQKLYNKQYLNINKLDKKHNRLMNDVCVQKAPR